MKSKLSANINAIHNYKLDEKIHTQQETARPLTVYLSVTCTVKGHNRGSRWYLLQEAQGLVEEYESFTGLLPEEGL